MQVLFRWRFAVDFLQNQSIHRWRCLGMHAEMILHCDRSMAANKVVVQILLSSCAISSACLSKVQSLYLALLVTSQNNCIFGRFQIKPNCVAFVGFSSIVRWIISASLQERTFDGLSHWGSSWLSTIDPDSTTRFRQLLTVRRLQPNSLAMILFYFPSATAWIIFTRSTNRAGMLGSRDHFVDICWSESVETISLATCIVLFSLVQNIRHLPNKIRVLISATLH